MWKWIGVLVLFAANAQAADPSSGEINEGSMELEFTGGPFVGANPFGDATDPTCIDPIAPCDDYALTIDLSPEFIATFPSALVRITTKLGDEGANVREDYDLFLYDGNGKQIGESVSEGAFESISILPAPGVSEYVVRVIPYSATGSSYVATIEMLPGEPVESTEAEDAEGRSVSLLPTRGGAMGGIELLLLMLLGLQRRRMA